VGNSRKRVQWARSRGIIAGIEGREEGKRAFTTKYTKPHEGKRRGMRMDDWIKAPRKI
jgi:hypothetical protein